MSRDNSILQRIPKDIKQKLDNLSCELTAIEKKKIHNTDILKRVFNSQEIIDRLKLGSIERRCIRR